MAAPQSDITHPHRFHQDKPWGGFDELTLNEKTTVKILTIRPGEELSLQAHEFRDEWWIVLDEAMKVILDDHDYLLAKGDEIFIPRGAKHRVVGLHTSCRWLEIAYGEFLEADITRFDDKYGRV